MTIKVKDYSVPFLTEEGITNNAFVYQHQAYVFGPFRSWHGPISTIRSDGQTGKKSVTICLSLLYFQILSPVYEGVGKCLSKEQRKRERVVGADEKKRKEEIGLGNSHGEAQLYKKQ